jgi:hypothetical protein
MCQGQCSTVCACASCLLRAALLLTPLTAHRLPPTVCCLPLTARRLTPTAYAYHLPPAACRLRMRMCMPPVLHTYRLCCIVHTSMYPFLRSRAIRDGRARSECRRLAQPRTTTRLLPRVARLSGSARRSGRVGWCGPLWALSLAWCEQRPRARSLAARSALKRHALPPPLRLRLPWPQTGTPSTCQHVYAGCCTRPCDRGCPASRRRWQQVGLVSCGAIEVLSMRAPRPREWRGVGWS